MFRPLSIALILLLPAVSGAADSAMTTFKRDVQPLLEQYCYDCHGEGNKKGGVVLDGFTSDTDLKDHKLWLRVLKNTRSHIMPPADEDRLTEDEIGKIAAWIKRDAFELDAVHPDPGHMTVRRLNRVEYHNTIKDLIGVDFDTMKEFPADDTGHGFDNIADVLTISPMLLERYLDAAQTVIASAVPTRPLVVAEIPLEGRKFVTVKMETPATLVADSTTASPETSAPAAGAKPAAAPVFLRPAPKVEGTALDLSYYTPATVAAKHTVKHAGKYQLVIDARAVEKYVDDQFDYNRARIVFKDGAETLLDREFVREGEKHFKFTFDREWQPGEREFTIEVHPVGPDRDQKRLLRLRLQAVTVRGPFDEKHWVQPPTYAQYFPRAVPRGKSAQNKYAREILRTFATRAFRRPVDESTLDRLVKLSETNRPEGTFESGIAQAMVAILASPRFIFREEDVKPMSPGQVHPEIDEYALASRLSYFLWSSMPDDELFRLAREGKLREQLPAQLDRMLASPKSEEFVRNFTGQWLQARDISNVQINAVSVFIREHPDPEMERAMEIFRKLNRVPEEKRTEEEKKALEGARGKFLASFRAMRPSLTYSLREAMQDETEMTFAHVIKEDRSLLELIESDYTFVNEELAKHYGIPGVTGKEMRKVQLPPGSPRGGVLTQGTVLSVTSNPTRTSPVKRGVFILEKILGTPPAPPPPNIPALEDVASKDQLAKMSLRETIALHAKNPMCRSCHNRMDPLGLALENFNAMGAWRDSEMNQPIDSAGKLITGEKFANIQELKHILATEHRRDYYYNITEKLLTYALGRGIEYTDVETVDQLVAQLEAANGRPSALIRGIVNSVPFQQRRQAPAVRTAEQTAAAQLPNG